MLNFIGNHCITLNHKRMRSRMLALHKLILSVEQLVRRNTQPLRSRRIVLGSQGVVVCLLELFPTCVEQF